MGWPLPRDNRRITATWVAGVGKPQGTVRTYTCCLMKTLAAAEETAVRRIVAELKGRPGPLLEVLHAIQADLGYVPEAAVALQRIAEAAGYRVDFPKGQWCCGLISANAGDFKTTFIGERGVIMTRDAGGEVHVLENRCQHKGIRLLQAPFGGNGKSGIGREGGTWSFDFYCDVKNTVTAPKGWTHG